LLEREETAKRRFDEHVSKTSSVYTQRIEGLEHNLQRAVSSFTETKKRLEEEQRFKEEAERMKKEFESQRDELRDTLRRERENFEKDGKLLRFACEDATKELEIVKQSYREEKQHDEQVIQGLRDALDAVVAENEEKKKVGESTFSPPATPPKSPSAISQSFQMEKDQLELEVATQKELANQAKEKAERAIKTARVAMEAAATRAKTDGVKIEKLEKQLAEARRASNDETSTTTMSTKEDDENENDNDDNTPPPPPPTTTAATENEALVEELKMRIEKLESHCADASAAATNAADALDAANEELAIEREKCSSLEREMLTLSNDFSILTEAFEKSQSELTMRDENLAALAKELELSLALNSNEDAAGSEKDSALSTIDKKKYKKNEKRGPLSDDESYDSDEDENDLSMTTGNETMSSLRAELSSLRQIHDATERRANNYAERSKSAELARDSALDELDSLKREKVRLEERLESVEQAQTTPKTPKVKPALLKELEQTKSSLQKEIETLEGNAEALSKELADIEKAKSREIENLQKELEQAKSNAKKELNDTTKETETRLLAQMEALRDELMASNQHREEINEQRERAELDAKEAVTRYASLENDKNGVIAKLNEKVEALDKELKTKSEACKHVERQLEMATQAQKTQSKTAAKEVERAYAKKIKDLENEIASTTKLRDDAERAKSDLGAEIDRIKLEFTAYKASVSDKERDENLKPTTANFYEKMQAIRAAEELRAERNDLAQDLEDARADFMRSIREQTTRAEEAEAALEDSKLSAKIAADAARIESMEATSLARKHADEVAQARIALADARKHAAGAEKRADVAIARVERRCKEIEARTDRDVDRLTMAVETAEKAQKSSEEKAAHVDAELANAKSLVQRLADGLRDVRLKKEQVEKDQQHVQRELEDALFKLKASKQFEVDAIKFSGRIKELEAEVKELIIKAKRAEAAMVEAEKHAEHAEEAFDKIRQLEQEVSDLDARRSQAEAALKTTSGNAPEAFRALETENSRLEKRVKQTWQALQGAHAVAEQTKHAARDAVRTARQAAARAEKEAAFYRDRSEKAEAAKVEAMQRADNMINDAQQQADEYANEKLEKEKRKLQILEEKLREAQMFSKKIVLPKVKSPPRGSKLRDLQSKQEDSFIPSMPRINVGKKEGPPRKVAANDSKKTTAQLDDEMTSADLVLQEYLTRSRENSVRSSSPRSIG
jgi:chromosome segregation ATPase